MKVVVHLFQLHQITPVIALVLVIKDSIALLFVSTEIHQIVTIFFLPIVLPDIDISLSSTQVVVLEGNDLSVNCTVPGDVSYTIWAHEDGSIVVDNSSTLQHLYITNMTQSNSGRYSCIAGLENGTVIEYPVDVIVEGKCTVHID